MSGDFLESLKSEGALAKRGQFQLDQGKAREKMEKFQLVNPYLYVLELVQGAHLLGATRIDVTVDADEMKMTFDGDGLRAEEMTDIYSAAFSRDPDDRVQAKRHFAIALTAVGAISAAEVRMVMRHGGEAVQLVRRQEGESIEPASGEAGKAGLNEFYVKEKFRFGHLFEFLDASQKALEEAKILERQCKYATIPIYVNGRNVSGGHFMPDGISHVVEIDWDGEKGLLGIQPQPLHAPDRRSQLKLVQNGVLITEVGLPGLHVTVLGLIETSRLTKNLSQSAFVEDEVFNHMLNEVVGAAVKESMYSWVKEVHVSTSNYTALREIALSTFREVVVRKVDADSPIQRLATALELLPIWPIATELNDQEGVFRFGSAKMSSLRRLKEGPPNRPIPFTDRRFHSVRRDDPVFLFSSESETAFGVFKRYTRREWNDVTDHLVDEELANKNRLRWRNRPWSEPHEVLHQVRLDFVVKGLQVSIFDQQDRHDGVTLVHVHDGYVLNSGRIPEHLPAAKVVIKGSLEVDRRFEAPMRTPRLKRVYMEIVKRLPQLWVEIAAEPDGVPNNMVRKQLGVALVQLLSGSYFNFALAGFGFPKSEVPNQVYDLVNDESQPALFRLSSTSYLSQFETRSERIRARIEGLGALAEVPVIPCSDRHYSLADLYRFIGDNGTAWTGDLAEVRRRIGDRRWPRGPIVDKEYPWGYTLQTTFEEVSDANAAIEVEVARLRFERRPKFQLEQVLMPSRHLLIGSTTADRWSARWGVRKLSTSPDCWVFPLFKERLVEKVKSERLFGMIDIVVEGPVVELNEAGDGLGGRGWIDEVQEAVVEAALAETRGLASKLGAGERVGERELELVWSMMVQAVKYSHPLADIPFVRDEDGEAYNAFTLVKMAKEKRLHWVSAGHPVLESAVAAGEPVIVVPSIALVGLLEQIVEDSERLVDCNATEQRQRDLERARGRFYARPTRRDDVPFSVAKAAIERDGRTTIAGLSSGSDGHSESDSTIVLCREWREVENLRFSTPFGHFRVVHDNPKLRLDPQWNHVEQDTGYVVTEAREAAAAALVEYLNRVLLTGATQPESIRVRVADWLAKGLSSELNDGWGEVWELLRSVPIFMGYDSNWKSVNQIASVAEVGLVPWVPKGEVPAEEKPGMLVLDDRQLALLRRIMPGKLSKAPLKSDVVADAGVDARGGGEKKPVEPAHVETSETVERGLDGVVEDDSAETLEMPAVEAGPDWNDQGDTSEDARVYEISAADLGPEPGEIELTPDEKLVGAIQRLMRRASENSRGFLPNAHIESVVLWGNDRKRAARITPEKVSVTKDHAATIYALEDMDDPVRRALLTSAVITALNFHYEEIADTDEIELQRALLEQWSADEKER